MSSGNSGLFYAPNLVAMGRPASPAFCKPINIRVYSAPPPVRMRVVTYEMVYWNGKAQPNVLSQWGELVQYQSPMGHRNFSFTIGTLPKTLDEILTDIRRQFFDVVQGGKACRSRDEGMERLFATNSADQSLNMTAPQKVSYRVYDVHHLITVRLNLGLDHFVESSNLRYHCKVAYDTTQYLMDESFISAPMEYTDNRDLVKQALRHLQSDETVASLKTIDNQSMV